MRRMTEALHAGHFYGVVERRLDLVDALFSIVRHERALSLPEHTHERPYFCLLLEGDYDETSAAGSIVYQPLTIVYHPARAPHVDTIGSRGGKFFLVELGDPWSDCLPIGDAAHISELDGGAPVWSALRLYQEIAQGEAVDPLTVESLVLETCAHIAATSIAERVEPAWVSRAADRIRAGFAEPIDLRGLAREADVHPIHFARTYRRFRHRSVGEDVQFQRIQHACRALSRGDAIAEVALAFGFTDQSYFTRVFRRITRTTPAAFQARMRCAR